MKRGCALTMATWLLLVGAYGYVAWTKTSEVVPAAMIGVLGGTFAGVLVSSVVGLFTGAGDRRAIDRGLARTPLQDGHLEAVSGPIRPTGPPLESPFTGRPCVAYEYDIRKKGEERPTASGVALAPCVVDDSSRGSVRVLGWTVLDQFPKTPDSAINRARTDAYLQTADFERVNVLGIVSVFRDLLADDDGAIRKDMWIVGAEQTIQHRTVTERMVPIGEVVTLMGRWSQARQGFTPAGSLTINRLLPGDLQTLRKHTAGAPLKTLGIGVFFFVALHAILVPMYLLAPNPEPPAKTTESVWDERDCDRQKLLLAAGANPNERGHDGTTPLMNSARYGFTACVENLIAAGASLDAVDPAGETALAQAIRAGRSEVVEILRRAAARER